MIEEQADNRPQPEKVLLPVEFKDERTGAITRFQVKGIKHIRNLTGTREEIEAAMKPGGELGEGSFMPPKWGGPVETDGTSPMLQEAQSTPLDGQMLAVTVTYIEIERDQHGS